MLVRSRMLECDLSVDARHGFHRLCIANHGASMDSIGSDANGKPFGTGSEKEVDKSVSEAISASIDTTFITIEAKIGNIVIFMGD